MYAFQGSALLSFAYTDKDCLETKYIPFNDLLIYTIYPFQEHQYALVCMRLGGHHVYVLVYTSQAHTSLAFFHCKILTLLL